MKGHGLKCGDENTNEGRGEDDDEQGSDEEEERKENKEQKENVQKEKGYAPGRVTRMDSAKTLGFIGFIGGPKKVEGNGVCEMVGTIV